MPILHVIGLPQKHPEKIQCALKEASVVIAKIYGCSSEQVWSIWQDIAPGYYVEGENTANSQPEATHPPIATLTCFEGKSDEVIESILLAASQSLCRSLNLKANVFITYNEVKSGRVIAGDGIIKKIGNKN